MKINRIDIKRFIGRTAIVTGAGQGIGRTVAQMFASEGASVMVNDINNDAANKVAEQINHNGGKAIGYKANVACRKEVISMVEKILSVFGRVDILVNNAGVLFSTRFENISEEEWDLVMNVNVKGTFLCSQAVIPAMKKNNYGRVINLSSTAGRNVSTLGGAHYTSSKAAILGLARAIAKEMAAFGITANSICPGLIDTEMVRKSCLPEQLRKYALSYPIQRLGTTEEVSSLILFLASPQAAYITGAAIDIDGGDLMI